MSSYASEAWWLYSDVRETTLSAVTEGVLLTVAAPFGLLMIPLLFLVAGLFSPPSLERRGLGAYVRGRLLRLGVPFVAFVLLWPLLEYALFRGLGAGTGSYWSRLMRADEPLQSGPVWFVGALLVYSLAYAGWARLRHHRQTSAGPRDIRSRHLFLLAAVVTVTTFLVRLDIPFDSDQYVALNLYQWPGCIALFALGVLASPAGWLAGVPQLLQRQSRTTSLAAVGGFAVFAAYGVISGGADQETWMGGWHLDAFLFVLLESLLTVFGPVWLLGAAQRHLDRSFRWAPRSVRRSAYGAFMLQGIFLTAAAVGLRPLPVPAGVKALVVAAVGVAGSFVLAWLLVKRVPGVSRVL